MIAEPRSDSHATRYSLQDAILGVYAAFFLQNESFLEYQRQLNSRFLCPNDCLFNKTIPLSAALATPKIPLDIPTAS